ncbi:MAG: tetratricopeptide repeat protein [Chitinophagaceae bacterium]
MKLFKISLSAHAWNSAMKFILFALIIFSFSCTTVHNAKQSSDAKIDTKRKLTAGENHLYTVHLNPEEFLHIRIIQNGIDVIAKVSSEDKQYAEQFDSPTGELGPEDIYLLSSGSKNYTIEIFPAQKFADPGEYAIKTIRQERASEKDKNLIAALSSTQKADKVRSKTETRLQSIDQYKSAAAKWKAMNDMAQYANTMRSLGFVYIRQKNYEEAINTFKSLLPVWNQVGDVRSEGFTHLIIGRIYDLQKDYKTSLDYNLSSLESWRKVNDFDQETFVLMNIGNLYGHLSDRQKAIDYFELALKKNEQSERSSIKAVVLRDYANAMLALGDSLKAITLYERSIKQWQSTANKPEEARTAIQLAAYYEAKGNKEKAIYNYRNALEIWLKLNDQKEIKIIQSAIDKLEK